MMLIQVANKGSVPYCGSNYNNSTGVSLSEILFSYMLEKYFVCDWSGLRSPSIASNTVLYITAIYISSMQEFIMQGVQQKLEKSYFRCNWFRYVNNNFTKHRCSLPINMTVILGLHKFSLQATIDHHVPSMYSGHYTASINCCKKLYCNSFKETYIPEVDVAMLVYWMIWYIIIYDRWYGRTLYHHDFHHDSCDHQCDFYGHFLLFELHFMLSVLNILVLQMYNSLDISAPGNSPWTLDWTCYLRIPLCYIYIPY